MSEDDGHVLLVHAPGQCPNHNDPEYYRDCMFCDGGLSACTVCDAFEGAWPDECPGERMTYRQSDEVYAGRLNFRDGQWHAECCRIRRPADEVLREEGYVQDEHGRWRAPEEIR
jgi:hypothetical protein